MRRRGRNEMKKCIFCNEIHAEHILMETFHFQVVLDIDPIQQGHLLIMTKNHLLHIAELSEEQLLELGQLEQRLIGIIEHNFDVLGVTIAQNNGNAMDPAAHFHVHVIPRYTEDGFWNEVTPQPHPLDIEKLKNLMELF
ncbi:HIT family protein [Staphylococcus auricularis]|uniref:HIT family protein n=1 Tax=Staphylococcus auricularis TaxID=29379 RepID=UPI0030B8ECCD